MTPPPGTRLGPYEIVAPLGAGGMGEVYRASDTRLGRQVALKVLPSEFAKDPDRLRRFEQEARAASALNHPNIVVVYDVGQSDGTSYLAMELVTGRSLRALLEAGAPLATRRLLEIGTGIADGLSAAHAGGIVHRDLKPENVVVSADGHAKVLDFGVAKLAGGAGEDDSTLDKGTAPGTVLGTAGYMSPEQASGRAVDFRSDQFSLGSMLYEMATGRRAFKKDTAAETLAAIIREEPTPIAQLDPAVPVPLRWIVERCLAKDPDERYASTKDLARDLKSVRDHLSEAGVSAAPPHTPRSRAVAATASALILIALAAAALALRHPAAALPAYRQLTFRRGTLDAVRYSPDGHSVIYSAAWEGRPREVFEKREASPESRPLGLVGQGVLSISRSGPLAVLMNARPVNPYLSRGTLGEVTLGGTTAPREIVDDVASADWAPGSSAMAVVRAVEGRLQLEYPMGTVLYRTSGWLSHARVAPDGEHVAFIDHPIPNDDGGSIVVTDRRGNRKTLVEGLSSAQGLAWSPDGSEVWFTGAGEALDYGIRASTLDGRQRLLMNGLGILVLHDLARDGRALASHEHRRIGLFGRAPGDAAERDLSWLDWSLPGDISKDGQMTAFSEAGQGGGPGYSAYIRRMDGSPAVRLGDGVAHTFSPDGRSVVAIIHPSRDGQLAIYPVGVGQPRLLPREGLTPQVADWMPDGQRILFTASEEGKPVRLWLVDVVGGKPRPVSPERFRQAYRGISADGRRVVASGPGDKLYLHPLDGGEPTALPGLTSEDALGGWAEGGRSIYVFHSTDLPVRVYRYDVATGRKELWKEIVPPDPVGFMRINRFLATPDGSAYVYSYMRNLSELFEITGLR